MRKDSLAYLMLKHCRDWLRDPAYRAADGPARREFSDFARRRGGRGLRHDLRPRGTTGRRALIVSINFPPFVPAECWLSKVLQFAGFDPFVLADRRHSLMRYYRLAGVDRVLSWADYPTEADEAWIQAAMPTLTTLADWLRLQYQGVHVGRFAVASVMRLQKRGRLDFRDAETFVRLRGHLRASLRHIGSAIQLLDTIRPESLLFLDRGYTGQGELFELALARGLDVMSWGDSYRSNLLTFKRFNPANERDHYASLSAATWDLLRALPPSPEYGQRVREFLHESYESQDWLSFVGTQFGTRTFSARETRQRLGLAPEERVAAIFPHILWDGSFFWGVDLFDDYTEWFTETLKAAQANPNLTWLVKLHPAHVVKSKREGIAEPPSEMLVINDLFQVLPPNLRLLQPDDQVSTHSVLSAVDYAVTVRGTVGMEAALFGIPVVTAGTGRYDRRGFTLDSATREEYLRTLATLHTRPPLTPAQVELAERFAFGTLLCRPLRLTSMKLASKRDALATAQMAMTCQSREDWMNSADIRHLASWLADGKTEDLFALPPNLPS